jgi:S-DNA-T family DNA segregation ATPase FtsK/SpoIIIE
MAAKTQQRRRAKTRSRRQAKRSLATVLRPRMGQRQLDVLGLCLIALSAFLAFLLYFGRYGGSFGQALEGGLLITFGKASYVAPVLVCAAGVALLVRPIRKPSRSFKAGLICLLVAVLLGFGGDLFSAHSSSAQGPLSDPVYLRAHGGFVGALLYSAAEGLLQRMGYAILVVLLAVAGLVLASGRSVSELAGVLSRPVRGLHLTVAPGRALQPLRPLHPGNWWKRSKTAVTQKARTTTQRASSVVRPTHVEAPPLDGTTDPVDLAPNEHRDEDSRAPHTNQGPASDSQADAETHAGQDKAAEAQIASADLTPQGRLRSSVTDSENFTYKLPQTTFLKRSSEKAKVDHSWEERLGGQLVEALGHFGVKASVVGTVSGPHVTRYELRLAPGTKMSKVAQLTDDLSYELAATDVRILAPIPGKQAVGVEVPNSARRTVYLGDVFQEAPEGWSPLTVWLGKDIAGKAIGTDIAKQPHVLIAGTTGSGKSGCVNAMLASILFRASPREVNLVLIDPKHVELNHYESIPHLITPVVTNPRLASNVLANLIKEMEQRYSVMSMARTRSLDELNRVREERGERPFPYILCVIDELADLMMVAPGEVEDSIIRLAQKSRAVGIHLLLATQRPSADIITGMIKANVPTRIAFAVSSQTDSRVVLDQNGAESLLGQGDMLFKPASSSRTARIQGAFITEAEINKVTDHWRSQGEPQMQEELLQENHEETEDESPEGDRDSDSLLGEAISTAVQMGTASTSMLQRRLRVGYTRAGRLIDIMERRGVISGYEGSKARQVLVSEADLPQLLASLDQVATTGTEDNE